MSNSKLWFVTYIINLIAINFYNGSDKVAYNSLKKNGLLDYVIENYDILHTFSSDYLLEDLGKAI
jgi:hypothetical protein